MKAVRFKHTNGLTFEQGEINLPEANDDQVLIKVEHVGLSFIDTKVANCPCEDTPNRVFGIDAVGTVEKACKTGFPEPGTRVFWHGDIREQGTMSEFAIVPSHALTVLPANVDGKLAAAAIAPAMCALIALFKLQLNRGDTILIEAAHHPVGQMAVQFAKQLGVGVAACTQAKHKKLVEQLGADLVYTEDNLSALAERLQQHFGEAEVQGALDLTGTQTQQLINHLVFCGRVSCLAGLPAIEQHVLMKKAPNIGIVSLCGSWLSNSVCAQQRMAFIGNVLAEKLEKDEVKLSHLGSVLANNDTLIETLDKLADDENITFFCAEMPFN
ncbi:oxidoreductase [Pseudoalteromonas sp. J010]|uniref:zinc-binding dehydrogenase n=1 Tax=Pseudoalteromonas sp. J010 TaxID=998465 RepID=UPI000F650F6E|nr:zinc-binding dehydrogenase [Pseudoalteromonas sp. J010]RRS08515.1 oxidoreductase [Pseudoalteromonas sp. J010]